MVFAGGVDHAKYDVFLSLGGQDRQAGRHLAEQLRFEGLRVFVDEDDIAYFAGITQQVQDALSAAKVLVVYYSRSYPLRPSCQLELTAVFLAGQLNGHAAGRIVVINPEESTEHLQPTELADARFISTSLGVEKVAQVVCKRVRGVAGVIGDAGFRRTSAHHGRIPGAMGFVGQYREHWQLHSALHADDVTMTQEPAHGPVVAVGGLPGIGKSSFVAAYAWRFWAAFPGGVFWTRLGGESAAVLSRYREQLAEISRTLGLPATLDPTRLRGRLAAHFAARSRVLWIVDDLPVGVDPEILHELVLPAGPAVRTVLVTDRDVFSRVVPSITLTGLVAEDAAAMLERALPSTGRAEHAARDRLVSRLGGHGGALAAMARLLRDAGGQISYQQCEELIGCTDVWRPEAARRPDRLPPEARLVVGLAEATGFAPLGLTHISKAVLSHGLAENDREALTTAISGLRALEMHFLAVRTPHGWSVHPLAPQLVEFSGSN